MGRKMTDEFFDTVTSFLVLFYNFALIAGTAYLVQFYGWSMWTFALTICFFVSKTNPKKEEE
jgi:hypothetical protein